MAVARSRRSLQDDQPVRSLVDGHRESQAIDDDIHSFKNLCVQGQIKSRDDRSYADFGKKTNVIIEGVWSSIWFLPSRLADPWQRHSGQFIWNKPPKMLAN